MKHVYHISLLVYPNNFNSEKMTEVLQRNPVQEIVKGLKNEVPDNFIYKSGYKQADVESLPWFDEPPIDLSILFDSSSPDSQRELDKLRSVLGQTGGFQAINHGMSGAFLDEVRQVAKKFFKLPLEEKQKFSRGIDEANGYGNDTVVSETQTLDWLDRLYLTFNPVDQRKLKYWPEDPPEFKEVVSEYNTKLRTLFDELLKAMARALSLEENSFLEEHGEVVMMAGRFNYYPPCPSPSTVLGAKPHADGSAVTFLLQDKEVDGLQVLYNDQWYRVPTIPDAIFINVGDYLEIMSNGKLKSPIHRVVTNTERERMSLAVFCFPDTQREIGPIPKLITDDCPQKFRRVRDFESLFFKNYQLSQRPLDAVRL